MSASDGNSGTSRGPRRVRGSPPPTLRSIPGVAAAGQGREKPERYGHHRRRDEERPEASLLRQRGGDGGGQPAADEEGGGEKRDHRGARLRHDLGGPGLERGMHKGEPPPTSTAAAPTPAKDRPEAPEAYPIASMPPPIRIRAAGPRRSETILTARVQPSTASP